LLSLIIKPKYFVMKKYMLGSILLITFLVVAAGVYAQTTDKEKKQNKTECTFIDNNKDGKCDICGSTADACKKDCTAAESKNCGKCPSAASCTAGGNEVVPAKEGTGTTHPCCANKK
jgi:hypothetical protein